MLSSGISLLLLSARVFIDPGHGAGTNSGATTARCETEAAVNLRISASLAERLGQTHRVRVARKTAAGPSYKARAASAAKWQADVLLSVHADTRGDASVQTTASGRRCPVNDVQPGFAVLVSDEGEAKLAERRRTLARAIAQQMVAAGFTAYGGDDYGTLYDRDRVAGVFIDRRGLFMLRRPKMPSVIIETHHAWHRDEVKRWSQPKTLKAFAKAVDAALTQGMPKKRAAVAH